MLSSLRNNKRINEDRHWSNAVATSFTIIVSQHDLIHFSFLLDCALPHLRIKLTSQAREATASKWLSVWSSFEISGAIGIHHIIEPYTRIKHKERKNLNHLRAVWKIAGQGRTHKTGIKPMQSWCNCVKN